MALFFDLLSWYCYNKNMTTTTKTCRTCGDTKSQSEFSITDQDRGYTYPHCKACCAAKKRAARAANPEKIREYQRGRYHREEGYEDRMLKARRANLRTYHRMRDEIKRVLGGSCATCGTNNWAVLQIDHRRNNGASHRRVGGYTATMRDIRNVCRNDPTAARREYQLLCGNCHHIKSYSSKM